MFKVDWLQSALDELARIWLRSDSAGRRAITAAAERIDQDLAEASDTVGESRWGTIRIHFVAPLGLTFEVDEVARTVRVASVWFVR